jgi:hypothetical protein
VAVTKKAMHEPVTDFDDWYVDRTVNERTGCLEYRGFTEHANTLYREFEHYKREHAARVELYWKYEIMADAEVVSKKPDLPNVSSGEIAGIVRRTARNVVQHTPNVEIICEFDDDSPKGILARHVLKSKIIGEEYNSNEMQQNLFASVMSSFTLGFEAVTPQLQQRADKSWVMNYDVIHYRDVFPEPGVKDARRAPTVFVRRYLTRGELRNLITYEAAGWDNNALRAMAKNAPPNRQHESTSLQDRKHHSVPDGYEIITWYTNSGDPFLTFDASSKLLLRIEANKDPLKRHPVQMLVLEKDPQQPLGKSQISLVYGRQEFQDLMLNGAMKLWYKNINPTLIGYGTGLNGVPNMSPGKYTNIPNPNARIEPFEVNTQTLLQYGQISQQNMGSMVNLVGAADQQMAAAAGNGMSATPQGVDAQQQMVDITTNNYQKAVENFFSLYCSYALTVYFAELKGVTALMPSADTRQQLIDAGMDVEMFAEDGKLKIDMSEMATTYYVRCVPGSLVEMEDEKQLRILNELFVPLSQAMPALAQSGNPEVLANAAAAMQYIIQKEIQLSGSSHAGEIQRLMKEGQTPQVAQGLDASALLEDRIAGLEQTFSGSEKAVADSVSDMRAQMSTVTETMQLLLEKLGVTSPPPSPGIATPAAPVTGLPAA